MSNKRPKYNQQHLKVLPGEGKRFSFANFKQAVVFYLLLLLALVVIIQLGYHWLGDQFLAWRLQVVAAEPGVMQEEVYADGVVTRLEEVVASPAAGMVLYLAAAGERFPAGSKLATIGVLSRAEMQALRGSEEQEPDEDLWDQLTVYWQQVFKAEDDQEDEAVNEASEDENSAPLRDPGTFQELISVYNEEPGLLSTYIDGLENYNGPYYPLPVESAVENAAEEDENDDQGSDGFLIKEGDLVDAGQPILKIVNNWEWYFSLVLPLHPGRTLTDLPELEIIFSFSEQGAVPAILYHAEIDEQNQKVRLTYLIEKQLPGFEQVRFSDAVLIYNRRQGIIVPEEAIFDKSGQIGLYLNQGGRVVFQPVSVVQRQDGKAMVEDLEAYSMIITRPDLVQEGQRLN
ncbi:MAG: HlyD family efflux transporter periplasmic adaptor subunit [Dethiobacteria bacterium]|nr:HlyD family efflux transporter periplasmic adaptor subunit [Dethiobacteria bacterium]